MKVAEFMAWCSSTHADFATAMRRATAHLAGAPHSAEDVELALDEYKKAQSRAEPVENETKKPPAFASLRLQLEAMIQTDRIDEARDTLTRAAAIVAVMRGHLPDDFATMFERRREWRFAIYDERGRELDLDHVPPAPPKTVKPPLMRSSRGRFVGNS